MPMSNERLEEELKGLYKSVIKLAVTLKESGETFRLSVKSFMEGISKNEEEIGELKKCIAKFEQKQLEHEEVSAGHID